MIKKCKVLINNEAVTVFNYDGIEVQIPSIKRTAGFIDVINENGKYIVVDDNYGETKEKLVEKPKKKINKKTTVKRSVNDNKNYIKKENEDA